MTEPDSYAEILEVASPLVETIQRSAIEALHLPPGSRGLDAGCGIGLQAMMLAEAVGPGGHVTGLDLAPEHVDRARELVERAGLVERISFQKGDVTDLPFDDDRFDWAWSADCVGYGPQLEGLRSLEELARVVKPGGHVAILAWCSQMLLPGYPLLEARLNATSSGLAPFVPGEYRPEWHFPRALGWFRETGLEELSAHTFVGDVHAPLNEGLRSAMAALFAMRWYEVEPELAPEDWAEYQRLCLPESPEFIVDHPDYYAFFTYSMFRGRVA
jgi:demethylmenaquinone methyltransferase/2-methoxy-6-polyprenyl-1,4-benzoquinol methylase